MENRTSKYDSLEFLFDRIFDSLVELTERMDKTDESNEVALKEIRQDIAHAREEMKIFLIHYDTVVALSKNLSPEGLKEMVEDVIELKNFMATIIEREAQRKENRALFLKIAIPVFMFLLGAAWWILQNYFMIASVHK